MGSSRTKSHTTAAASVAATKQKTPSAQKPGPSMMTPPTVAPATILALVTEAERASNVPRRLASGRNGRRSGLALPQLATRRVRCDLDPPLLTEVVDNPVEIFDRLALVDLCARDHVDAVAAVRRKGWPRASRRAGRDESEREARQSKDKKDKDG